MSGIDGLQLDADGFLDMDQFPDDGTDLVGADLDGLREVLHADPVDEPSPEQWDAIFDDVIGADGGDTGPFALDDVDGVVIEDADGVVGADDVLPDTDGGTDDGAADDDATDPGETGDDGDPDALWNVPADDLALDDVTGDDLDLDVDGGLDLADDVDVDDAYAPDGLDDGPADISHDFEDLL